MTCTCTKEGYMDGVGQGGKQIVSGVVLGHCIELAEHSALNFSQPPDIFYRHFS
jgi:hypothetical protein